MIGIYKITNKTTGKSYIGQSIHCGKRLDEHCNGDQLIDQIIQEQGINNFTFEILKETNKNELSVWEDYYIMKYNTIYPNGFNKRWNCSEELRSIIRGNYIEKENNCTEEENKEGTVDSSFYELFFSEKEIKIIKRAREAEIRYGKRGRVSTLSELQNFHEEEKTSIMNRIKINNLLQNSEKELTQAEQRWYKEIKERLKQYTDGFSLWHLGDTYFEREDFNDYGIVYKIQNNWEFTENKMIRYVKFKTPKIFQPVINLIKKKYINEDKIHFISNNKEIPFNEELIKEYKNIDKIYFY